MSLSTLDQIWLFGAGLEPPSAPPVRAQRAAGGVGVGGSVSAPVQESSCTHTGSVATPQRSCKCGDNLLFALARVL
jgi:hypothetical protein